MNRRQNENGNVLLVVLIGIVMFGALSFSMSSTGNKTGETGLDRDQVEIQERAPVRYLNSEPAS